MSVAATSAPAVDAPSGGNACSVRGQRHVLLASSSAMLWSARRTTARAIERRAALLGAIEDIRGSGADFSALDARHIKGMERTAGLKDLRFETEPVAGDREIQSVLSGNGRIIGWFSWEPDRSMSNALSQLRPLLGADRRVPASALPALRCGWCGARCAISARASGSPGRWRTRTCSPACTTIAR